MEIGGIAVEQSFKWAKSILNFEDEFKHTNRYAYASSRGIPRVTSSFKGWRKTYMEEQPYRVRAAIRFRAVLEHFYVKVFLDYIAEKELWGWMHVWDVAVDTFGFSDTENQVQKFKSKLYLFERRCNYVLAVSHVVTAMNTEADTSRLQNYRATDFSKSGWTQKLFSENSDDWEISTPLLEAIRKTLFEVDVFDQIVADPIGQIMNIYSSASGTSDDLSFALGTALDSVHLDTPPLVSFDEFDTEEKAALCAQLLENSGKITNKLKRLFENLVKTWRRDVEQYFIPFMRVYRQAGVDDRRFDLNPRHALQFGGSIDEVLRRIRRMELNPNTQNFGFHSFMLPEDHDVLFFGDETPRANTILRQSVNGAQSAATAHPLDRPWRWLSDEAPP